MKIRIKHLALLVVLLLTLGCFAGCSTSKTSSASNNSASTAGITVEYSSEDMDGSWDASKATNITLNGNSIKINGSGVSASGSTVTITKAGTYVLSGTLTNGQIIVNAGEKDKVRLVLNGASITCSDNAPIYAQQAKKTIITLAEGTMNTITDSSKHSSSAENAPDAAVFSQNNLTINGSGSLTVKSNAADGIGTKDDLVITGGKITVTAANDGLSGRDSIAINGGTFAINAGGEGLQSNNDTDTDKGWISLDGGSFTITAVKDGIQAETQLQITSGKITLTTGGGSAKATVKNNNQFGLGRTNASTTDSETTSTKGIKAGKAIYINGGTINVDSCDDAIHSNGSAVIKDGTFAISAGGKGIHADSNLTINAGIIKISKSYEGLEGKKISINGGDIDITSSDDGINGVDKSSSQNNSNPNTVQDCEVKITSGSININASGDGLDSNGDLTIEGGTIVVNGPTSNGDGALDYNGSCKISGGVLIAAGSSGMAEQPDSSSTQNTMMVCYSSVQKAGTLVNLVNENGKSIIAFTPAKDYQSIVISAPALEKAKTYTLQSGGSCSSKTTDGLALNGTVTGGSKLCSVTISDTATSISDDGSAYSGRGGIGGPGGNRMPPGGQRPSAQ